MKALLIAIVAMTLLVAWPVQADVSVAVALPGVSIAVGHPPVVVTHPPVYHAVPVGYYHHAPLSEPHYAGTVLGGGGHAFADAGHHDGYGPHRGHGGGHPRPARHHARGHAW